MNAKVKKKNVDKVQIKKIVYLGIIALCVIVLAFMVTYTCFKYQKNAQLKKDADAIVEKYKMETIEHNNKKDQDYADIYFDDNVIYIPNENVIIEYQP